MVLTKWKFFWAAYNQNPENAIIFSVRWQQSTVNTTLPMTSQGSINMSPSSLSGFHLQKIWGNDSTHCCTLWGWREMIRMLLRKLPFSCTKIAEAIPIVALFSEQFKWFSLVPFLGWLYLSLVYDSELLLYHKLLPQIQCYVLKGTFEGDEFHASPRFIFFQMLF